MNHSNNNISKRLILYILLFSSVITVVLTLIQLNLNYRHDLNLIEQRFEQIELTNVNSITQKVWTVDNKALQNELESILKLPDITYIEFEPIDSENKTLAFGQTDKHTTTHTIPIKYEYRNDDILLGELHIVAGLSQVYQRLLDTAFIILFTQALKTFAVSFFILILFKNILTRHLAKIVAFIEDEHLFKNDQRLTLDRNPRKWHKDDELDTVTRAINRMLKNIRQTISTLKVTQQKLFQAQDLSRAAFWEYDPVAQNFHLNPQANKLLHIDADTQTMSLHSYLDLLHPQDRIYFREQLVFAANKHSIHNFEVRVLAGGMTPLTFSQGIKPLHTELHPRYLLGSMQDVTELAEQRQQLESLANTDSLTRLPNRHYFQKILAQRLKQLEVQPEKPFAILISDLDGFKEINDTLGHHAGDQLLQQISARFKASIGDNNHVARLGGDEFAFIIEGDLAATDKTVHQILMNAAESFEISDIKLSIGISIGISLAPDHGSNASDLLRYADMAMYNAKRKRMGYQVYSDENDVHAVRRLTLIAELKPAIETGQLTLYYQPKVTLSQDGTACQGVEALIRWNHPSYGLLPPDEFIPLAEMSNLIGPLSLWVISQAIEDLRLIQVFNPNCITSVNISSRNLHDSNFPCEVGLLLSHNQINANQFILEITESAIMEDPQQAEQSLKILSEMGFKISIDDFGTGHSSLAYLKNLPVNELKIDRTFVSDMLNDENDYTIVKSTIELAHNLGLTVTAEGVESAEIEAILINLKCEIAQGYFYSRPLSLEGLIKWMLQD